MSAVLVAYIPSPEGEAALTAGAAEAQRRNVRLVVVNATRGDSLVDQRYVLGDDARRLEDRLAQFEVAAELRQVNAGHDIADDLNAVADEVDGEVIVIGLRRRSQVGKLIMGSAATRILIGAKVPVLTVKP